MVALLCFFLRPENHGGHRSIGSLRSGVLKEVGVAVKSHKQHANVKLTKLHQKPRMEVTRWRLALMKTVGDYTVA